MNLNEFKKSLASWKVQIPLIKLWQKIHWKVIKRVENWVLVDCENWALTWVILPKEAKELERSWFDLSVWVELEAEVLDPNIMDEEWYYTISISKLLQYDLWKNIIEKKWTDEVITVIPTEANLWWLLVDMHGIKWFIPLSQLAPVHYPRVEDWDQTKIFDALLSLVYKEFKVRIINIDEDWQRMILSEREALREEREKIMTDLGIWNEYEWVVSWVSSYWLFVTIWWGIEWLVHISEITYGHVDNIDRFWKVWKTVKVKVIWLEEGKISLSLKKLKPDPWSLIPKWHKTGDVIEWEVIRYVPYGVFIRVFDDINWLVHLSEITDRPISNPAEVVKLWQIVKAKIILLDPERRKIWLSLRLDDTPRPPRKPFVKRPYKPDAKQTSTSEQSKSEGQDSNVEQIDSKPQVWDSSVKSSDLVNSKKNVVKKTTKTTKTIADKSKED